MTEPDSTPPESPEPSEPPAPPESPPCLCFTLSGLSKVALLPQAKLAWLISSGPEPILSEARARLSLIADSYLSASARS